MAANKLLWAFFLLLLGISIVTARESHAHPIGNPDRGKLKSEAHLCQECHGPDGNSESSAPHLAGQVMSYIFKQLKNFQSGDREHPVMNAMAAGIADQDLADIATYFSNQPRTYTRRDKNDGNARALYTEGDWKRNIVACKNCHGSTALGETRSDGGYPRLAGQQQLYLREQLLNWRAGRRSNSSGEIMNAVTAKLTDQEIEDLASFLSGF